MKHLVLLFLVATIGFNSYASTESINEKVFGAHRTAVAKRQNLNFASTRLLSKRQWKLIEQSQDQLVENANRSYGGKCFADPVMQVQKRNYITDLKKCIADLSTATKESDSVFCGGLYTDYTEGFSLEEIPKLLGEHKRELQFIEKNVPAEGQDKIKYFIQLSASCETKIGDREFSGGIGIMALFVIDAQDHAKLFPNSEHFNDLEKN